MVLIDLRVTSLWIHSDPAQKGDLDRKPLFFTFSILCYSQGLHYFSFIYLSE